MHIVVAELQLMYLPSTEYHNRYHPVVRCSLRRKKRNFYTIITMTSEQTLTDNAKTKAPTSKAQMVVASSAANGGIRNNNKSNNNRRITSRKKETPKTGDVVDDEINVSEETTAAIADNNNSTSTNTMISNMGIGGYGGMGMLSPMMGMGMMSPYYGMGGYGGMGMMGMGMMGSQWLFSLNQFLFGIQSVVFSLGQAVQIVGMNAQQMKHMYESLKTMVENAMGQVNKWGQLEAWEEITGVKGDDARRWMLGEENDDYCENDDVGNNNSTSDKQQQQQGVEDAVTERKMKILTHNEVIRRRRLAAFRWTMTLTISYFLYRGVRRLIRLVLYGPSGGNYRQIMQHQDQRPYYYGGGGRMSNQHYRVGGQDGYGMNRYSSYGGGGYGRRNYNDSYSQYSSHDHMGGGDYY